MEKQLNMQQQQPLPPQPYYTGGGLPQCIQAEKAVILGEKLQKMIDTPRVFGLGCMIYGVIFAICLYKGLYGISIPVLAAVSMGMLVWGFRYLNIGIKKKDWFYFIAWELLAISNCLTGSTALIVFNTCGMALLFLSFILTHFCSTATWGFAKYLGELFLMIFAPIAYIGYPFKAIKAYFSEKEKGKNGVAKYIWLGILIAIPFLFIIIGLLSSADVVFRSLFTDFFAHIQLPERPFYLFFLLVLGMVGSYSLLAYMGDGQIKETTKERKKWEPVIGITFLSLITTVYIIFSVIQISYLFLGSFELPAGYSYARYAREGFFQLLFVCILNLIIILVCVSHFAEKMALKIIMTVFSICTYIMLISSALRMVMYINQYQLTFLRVLVLWALTVIAILLAACIATIYKKDFPLFQYTLIVVTCCYILFSFAKPDYFIAKYNLSTGEVQDWHYLVTLSSDVVPALEEAGILDEMMSGKEVYDMGKLNLYQYQAEDMGILDFNISYYRAGRAMKYY